jgi:hypothetical protein
MSKRLRIPLSTPYNTRVSAVNATDTSSGYVGIAIVGLAIVGKTSPSVGKDARYVNCFQQTIDGRKYIVKRPGFGTQSTPASGKAGYAVLVWTGKGVGTDVISAFDSPSTIYNGTTSLGALSGKCLGITETFVSTTATLTFTADDSTGWYYDTGVGVATKITDVDFLGNAGETLVGTFAHMDGFACYMTASGKLGASDINSVTAYTANSYGSTNAQPDKGVGCVRFKNFIMAFGTESLEFWYNAGLSPFPLARAKAMTVRVGAISADAIASISDTVFWAGSTPQGGMSIFQYDGNLGRISTPAIDAQIILAGAANITLTAIRQFGLSFVLVNCSSVQTFAYCVEEKFWFEWNSTTPLWYKCAAVSMGGTMVNYAVSNISTAGKVFLQNHASLVFTDNGDAYTARIQTASRDEGTQCKKFYEYLDIDADTESSSSTLTISKSDDDYVTYDVLGTVDLSASRPLRLTRLGSAANRAWVFTHAAATPMRLRAAEGAYTVGQM